MTTEELKNILTSRINNLEQTRNLSSQIGNLEEVSRLDIEIEETRITLNSL